MKQQPVRFAFGSTLVVAFAAMVQAEDAFVDSVQIEVTPMASPAARAASVDWGVDLDHDQFITREEIELALAAATEHFFRSARLSGFSAGAGREGSAAFSGNRDTYRGFGANNSAGFGGFSQRGFRTNSIRMRRANDRLREVSAAYREFTAAEADEMGIANADFRARFAGLDGEQRTLLLKADTRGNNDGSLSVIEYVQFNEGWLFFKGPFEREFGETAHEAVMDTLLSTADPDSLDELGVTF